MNKAFYVNCRFSNESRFYWFGIHQIPTMSGWNDFPQSEEYKYTQLDKVGVETTLHLDKIETAKDDCFYIHQCVLVKD